MADFDFPYIWIERQQREKALPYAAKATGLRISYEDGVCAELIEEVDALIRYLRKNYYFPIRCHIRMTDHRRYHSREDGHIYYGIFYDFENIYPNKKVYPRIAVAAALWKYNRTEDIQYTILHELTHYFQWFFGEDRTRTARSLETEANRWAGYILENFSAQQSALSKMQ